MSWRRVAMAGADVVSGFGRTALEAGGTGGAHAPPVTASAMIALLRNLIERFDHVVEVGRVDLRRAGLARPRYVDVVADLPERRAVFLLAFVELDDHAHHRLVEPRLGRRIGERCDA